MIFYASAATCVTTPSLVPCLHFHLVPRQRPLVIAVAAAKATIVVAAHPVRSLPLQYLQITKAQGPLILADVKIIVGRVRMIIATDCFGVGIALNVAAAMRNGTLLFAAIQAEPPGMVPSYYLALLFLLEASSTLVVGTRFFWRPCPGPRCSAPRTEVGDRIGSPPLEDRQDSRVGIRPWHGVGLPLMRRHAVYLVTMLLPLVTLPLQPPDMPSRRHSFFSLHQRRHDKVVVASTPVPTLLPQPLAR